MAWVHLHLRLCQECVVIKDLVQLLHEVDGQLGLAIHRNTHDEAWKREATELISRIRGAIKILEEGNPLPPPMAPPGPYRPNPTVPERRGGGGCLGLLGALFGHSPMQVVDQEGVGRGTICRRCMKYELVR